MKHSLCESVSTGWYKSEYSKLHKFLNYRKFVTIDMPQSRITATMISRNLSINLRCIFLHAEGDVDLDIYESAPSLLNIALRLHSTLT